MDQIYEQTQTIIALMAANANIAVILAAIERLSELTEREAQYQASLRESGHDHR